jgi:hypothetical protein
MTKVHLPAPARSGDRRGAAHSPPRHDHGAAPAATPWQSRRRHSRTLAALAVGDGGRRSAVTQHDATACPRAEPEFLACQGCGAAGEDATQIALLGAAWMASKQAETADHIGGTGAVSMCRSRPYYAPTTCSSVSLPAGCANDRRRGVCGLHGAAAVALRGPLGGPVGARPRRAGAQGPARCAVLPAPLNRLAGLVSAAAAPAPRRPGGHASPGGRNRWPGPAATGREPSARSTAGC